MRILDRGFDADEAALVAGWAYEPPLDLCDSTEADFFLQPGHHPVYDGEDLVAFVCFGEPARVPGQVPEEGTVDVGAGIRPDLLGQRIGTALMPLVVSHARSRFAPRRLRGAIAEFNTRSRRVCLAAGFRPVRTFEGPQGRRFVELVLEVPGSQAEQGRGPKGRTGSSSAPSQAQTR